ncbi:MAG: RNA-directed DNA polymerase [Pirellulaceae bacterium]|nr:RNA-directed DNA polymerase [Pirellulaceae bacterium]
MSSHTVTIDVDLKRFAGLLHRRLQYRHLPAPASVRDAIQPLFGRDKKLCEDLVQQIVDAQRNPQPLRHPQMLTWLSKNPAVKKRFRHRKRIKIQQSLVIQIESDGVYRWPVPPIANEGQLADFLSLSTPRIIDWLTLPHRRRSTSVDHYTRVASTKRDGTIRWIEQPAPTLKRVQRLIAQQILSTIPLHDAASGFRAGHSVPDCARQHVRRSLIIRMDMRHFFGSIHVGRVRNLFLIAGYPPQVARTLAFLCTAPASIDPDADELLRRSRLPQGAPTSPAIANAVSFAMDRRISGLCKTLNVTYTRYADDLIFSCDHFGLSQAKRFATTVAVIAMEEGFQINFRKTAFMRHGNNQRVLGLTVNQKLNSARKEYETLRAILHNCRRDGPAGQNRHDHPKFRCHLRGRIAHIASVNPHRGAKLMEQFDQIYW